MYQVSMNMELGFDLVRLLHVVIKKFSLGYSRKQEFINDSSIKHSWVYMCAQNEVR